MSFLGGNGMTIRTEGKDKGRTLFSNYFFPQETETD